MNYYIVDAFADALFEGNPAGVCALNDWPSDERMQQIAAENNLSETAFFVKEGDGYRLRWFTPAEEIDLCGHATLASAYVIRQFLSPSSDPVTFYTQSGILTVRPQGDLLELDFPVREPVPADCPPTLAEALGAEPLEIHLYRDLLIRVKDSDTVANLRPNMDALRRISGCKGFIVTAEGHDFDFVSRFFAPKLGVPEDPVTGSSHCVLVPYWAKRLQKTRLVARQLARRGGTLFCQLADGRVRIAGRAVLYLKGEIFV